MNMYIYIYGAYGTYSCSDDRFDIVLGVKSLKEGIHYLF